MCVSKDSPVQSEILHGVLTPSLLKMERRKQDDR